MFLKPPDFRALFGLGPRVLSNQPEQMINRIRNLLCDFIRAPAADPGSKEPILDYDQMVVLDAEELAEMGIGETYNRLRPELGKYLLTLADVEETIDEDLPAYSVQCSNRTYDIFAPSLPNSEGESWGRATHAFFDIINKQLVGSRILFYAINGGNDLGGLFLSEEQVSAARQNLEGKADWPYLPTLEHPWYGQEHVE